MGRRLRDRISSNFGPSLTTNELAKVMFVTLVVSITIVTLRSAGTRERRTFSEPNSSLETNEY
ncbi:MAG TPA: hypothetical protein VF626_05705 [Chthoniobacterales bacterium]